MSLFSDPAKPRCPIHDEILVQGSCYSCLLEDDPAKKLYRPTHPDTSRLAAEWAAASGYLGEVQRETLDAVRRHPDRTVAEMEFADGKTGRRYGRRINELLEEEYITVSGERTCTLSGRQARTYRIAETPPKAKKP